MRIRWINNQGRMEMRWITPQKKSSVDSPREGDASLSATTVALLPSPADARYEAPSMACETAFLSRAFRALKRLIHGHRYGSVSFWTKFCLLAIMATFATIPIQAQVTAAPAKMTFQGRLTKPDGTPVADGTYSVRFSLHDALAGGNEKWSQTLGSVALKNGTFAALLDVNTANLFHGDLYLEIKIGSDAPLTPRQPLVSVPYALKANTVPDGSITADKLANDALNNLSWLLGGNTSTNPTSHFLGTTDSQPLVFRTNNTERMRLDTAGNLGIGTDTPGAKVDARGTGGVNVFAGDLSPFGMAGFETNFNGAATHAWFAENGVRVFSVTAGGGTIIAGSVGIGTDAPAARLDVVGTVQMTGFKMPSGAAAGAVLISDGSGSGAWGQVAVNWSQIIGIPGGLGGVDNIASGNYATVAGGYNSTASQTAATVAGGYQNTSSGVGSVVAGGLQNQATGDRGTVAGGNGNTASAGGATVGGGISNTARATTATVAGGNQNTAGAIDATVGGGLQNGALGLRATVAGGYQNNAHGEKATVGGGDNNIAFGSTSTVPGGYLNTAVGAFSFAAGRRAKANHDGAFVWSDTTDSDFGSTNPNQFLIRASRGVGINTNNPAGYGLNVAGDINASGNVRTNGGVLTSDARYKQNIAPFSNALDVILNLRGVTFDWNRDAWKDHRFPEGKQIGFIAQEIEKVLPELVTTDSDGYKAVAYQNVVPVLVEAIKTQHKQRQADQAEIADLKARLQRLEALLLRIQK